MRLSPLSAVLFISSQAFGAYTYLYTDTFSGTPSTSYWYVNGSVNGGGSGLTGSGANGGSVIYKPAVGGPSTTEYEVNATLAITASGGTFVLYTRATAGALTGPGAAGSFYSVEMTPTVTGGGCTMVVKFNRRAGGTLTQLGQQTMACANGMWVRAAQRSNYILFSTSLNEIGFVADATLPSGQPGFGAHSTPSGNGITPGKIGPVDVAPPIAFYAPDVRTAAYDNQVDLEWPGVTDDPNGTGVLMYQVYRGGTFMGNFRTPNYTDTTVAANTNYTYTITALDHHHTGASVNVTVAVPPAGTKDNRKLGVRALGTYWGASPENIDLQSGNLSFSIPAFTAQGRGGSAVPFRFSYNSQNWRYDSTGVWKMGTDVGYGWGWKLLAGSLTPVYSDWFTVHHYKYTDATGAEYRLDSATGGVWRSSEGIFVEYDAAAGRLYFPNGMYWEFGCMANGIERDAGTLYPTRFVDRNGNEIKIRYQAGVYYGGTNSSGRIAEVEDVRAASVGGGVYRTYRFQYTTEAWPHLTQIVSEVGDGFYLTANYTNNVTLRHPYYPNAGYGGETRLNAVSLTTGGPQGFSMEYGDGMELTKATLPYGGTLEWVYGTKALNNGRSLREVTQRKLNTRDGAGTRTYTIARDDAGDTNRFAHLYAQVADASGESDKVYYFHTAADYRLGLMSALVERKTTAPAEDLRHTDIEWAQVGSVPYIAATLETMNPGTGAMKKSRTEQEIDAYGNVKWKKVYPFFTGAPGTVRNHFRYNYVTEANYTNRRIRNLVASVTLERNGSGTQVTLVQNSYDNAGLAGVAGTPRQHDTANYGPGFAFRGNVTSTTSFGKTANFTYNYLGTQVTSNDGNGHTRSQTPDATRNFAVPSAVTVGTFSTAFSYNGYMAQTSTTGANAEQASYGYDSYARPSTVTLPNGSTATMTYSTTVDPVEDQHWKRAVSGSKWTKTFVDGLGRAVKVVSGYTAWGVDTVVSTVATQYGPCACTPVGKVWKTSLPYGPGGTVQWTEHKYDALGRTASVIQPNGRGTTEYVYAGNEVTVTDPAGKWKRFENDVEGHLVKVTEPNPEGGLLDTTYTYSDLGQLLTVNMTRGGVTQTRTWAYDAVKRERLVSVTHPESGTTLFSYNNDGTVAEKRDAKMQKLVYEYDADANGRLKLVKRLLAGGNEDICQRVTYHYDTQTFAAGFTQNANGRMAAVETGCAGTGAGRLIEMYSYTPAGAVTKKRLRVERPSGTVDRDFVYGYGADGKLATVLYPGASVPFSYTYDLMDRPTKMTGPSPVNPGTVVDHAKDVVYGAAGQVTGMQYLQWDDGEEQSYYNETKTYDELYQLIYQRTTGMSGTVAEIGYEYSANANNGRIIARKNYLRGVVDGEKVTYQYDSLNRVTSAAGTTKNAGGTEVNTWGQNFSYDGFGNLLSQAPKPGFPDASPNVYLTVNGANNRISSLHWAYDLNGNTTQMPVMGGGSATLEYDVDNRLKTWTGAAGVEQYGYLADNKRVWKKTPGGVETYYLYGLGGQKLMTCSVVESPFALHCAMTHVYFGGKVIRADGEAVVQDRLGSVVARGAVKRDYFPYGDEIGGATAGNVDKFGTYMRDQTTGLDYADQRYYAGNMSGRFLTADPYGDNWRSQEPKSWNMFSYVDGDPINFVDPNGLATCGELEITAGYFAGRTVDDVMKGTSGGDLMAQTIYHEGGTIYDSDLSSQSRYLLDLIGIGTAILNQWDVDNGRLQVYDQTGARTFPMGGSSPQNRSLEEVIISIARDGRGALFSSTGQMRQPDRAALNTVLQTNIEAAPLILDSTGYWINRSCEGVLASINVASGLLLGGLNDRYKPNGLVLLFWNLASADSKTTFPGSAGYIGVEKIRQQGHTFWGLRGGPPPAGRGADVGIPRPGRRASGH